MAVMLFLIMETALSCGSFDREAHHPRLVVVPHLVAVADVHNMALLMLNRLASVFPRLHMT